MSADDDPKVKDLIDAATRADLERWFSLPSFQQVAERPRPEPKPEDPEVAAVREQRQRALAAVDPALVEEHRRRVEPPDTLIKFTPQIDVHVDPGITMVDHELIERQHQVAEPREVEIEEALRDDLRDCTPQALLRDLHRAELDFEKTFERIDVLADLRVDPIAEATTAMTTRWALPPPPPSLASECRSMLAELRAIRRRPWVDLPLLGLPNRRITE